MKKFYKKSAVCILAAIIAISTIVFAEFYIYDDARVSFKGMEIGTNPSGGVQAFVDVYLENVTASGVNFCVQYDSDMMKLSNAKTNAIIPMGQGGAFDTSHEYFELDKAFSPMSFTDVSFPGFPDFDSPLGRADVENGYFSMHFQPQMATTSEDGTKDYIKADKDGRLQIMAEGRGGIRLGRISFNITDTDAFSRLTGDELRQKFKVLPFKDMYKGEAYEDYDYAKTNVGVTVSYVENGAIYLDRTISIGYSFELATSLISVSPQQETYTVNAYEIYKEGTQSTDGKQYNDLFAFLNANTPIVTLEYSHGTKIQLPFTWREENSTVIGDPWEPKGGKEYTVIQRYNDDLNVEVTVEVTPVSMTGVAVENQSITYLASDEENFPQNRENLHLPMSVRPILDTVILNGGIPKLDVIWTYDGEEDEESGLPVGFGETAASYVYHGDIQAALDAFKSDNEWLTDSFTSEITAVRNVVLTEEDMPFEITAEGAVGDDGTLEVTVKKADGTLLDEDTIFEIKMPGGEVISEDYYTYDPDTGIITITVDPETQTDETAKKLAEAINLGDRLGEFTISAGKTVTDDDGDEIIVRSPEVPFSAGRLNVYKGPAEDDPNRNSATEYIFDYSGLDSGLFPVADNGQEPPKTITLPLASDYVGTTFDGRNGDEPGKLTTVTVTSWSSATDLIPGGTSKVRAYRGLLADTSYTNYGEVSNRDNIYVVIKYSPYDEVNEDSITITPETFIYNKQQVGYDYDKLQTKEFTITNNGFTDIHGLWADISMVKVGEGSDAKNVEAFEAKKLLPQILEAGKSATLDISTKFGLDVGIYQSTVKIFSNNKELGTITLKFEVTIKPVHNIRVTSDNPLFGMAEEENGVTTATVDDPIVIKAKPNNTGEEIDYKFVGWEVQTPADLEYTSEILTTGTGVMNFIMPDEDVEVIAKFEETTGAKLRAEELYILPGDEELDAMHSNTVPLNDSNWQVIPFDSTKREYYAAVSKDTDSVKLWFSLQREESIDAVKKVEAKIIDNGDTGWKPEPPEGPATAGPVTITVHEPEEEGGYYKTDVIVLVYGPDENFVELSFTYTETEEDGTEIETVRKYKLHIFRKTVDDTTISPFDLVDFSYGNSPYGRILRDTRLDADAVKQEFLDNGRQFKAENVPANVSADVKYKDAPWVGAADDYDLNAYALFMVNSMTNGGGTAWDSGYITLRNSLGQDVTNIEPEIKRVTVNVLSEANDALQNGSKSDFTNTISKTIDLPKTGDLSLLFDERIRPDVYAIEYVYKDYDGSRISVTKPLIIIYPTGDINMDGIANDKDAIRIRERYSATDKDIANGDTVLDCTVGADIFRYRVVDTNFDGYINMLDGNAIEVESGNTLNFGYKNITESEVALHITGEGANG